MMNATSLTLRAAMEMVKPRQLRQWQRVERRSARASHRSRGRACTSCFNFDFDARNFCFHPLDLRPLHTFSILVPVSVMEHLQSAQNFVRALKAASDPPTSNGPLKIDIARQAWINREFFVPNKGELIVEWLMLRLVKERNQPWYAASRAFFRR
jgi:hypothetical protein